MGGKIVNGKKEGEARVKYPNGDVYVGQFENDLMVGIAIIKYHNGEIY